MFEFIKKIITHAYFDIYLYNMQTIYLSTKKIKNVSSVDKNYLILVRIIYVKKEEI